MKWTVLISGKQVASELNFKAELKKPPQTGELHLFETSQGVFLFRIEEVEYVPRYTRVLLVTRVRKVEPVSRARIKKLAARYNRVLNDILPGAEGRTCPSCQTVYLAEPEKENICPGCGF